MRNSEDIPLLHLYPQDTWHGNAAIVGNREGLKELRDAIDRVLNPALPKEEKVDELGMRTQRVVMVPGDGETYSLDVHHLDSDHENWDHLTLPYAENQDKNRGYGDLELQILPPSWGMGLARRLDVVSGHPDMTEEMWETFMRYHDLPDEEKREFKRELEEWEEMNTRGGAS